MKRSSVWVLSALCLVPDGWAQALSRDKAEEISPSHAYQQVALFRAEIELIRLEMGRAGVEPPSIRVEKAAPREVYFQAITLFRKADRLAYEHTRERIDEPVPPTGQIKPTHVHSVVLVALDRAVKVKEALNITEVSDVPPLETGIAPSQVFDSILAANRELNQLLDFKFAPGDVYQEVTLAIAYLARLLDSTGEVSTPPDSPPFERRKSPGDVYGKLVGCFDEIHKIGEQSGVEMLDLKLDREQVTHIEPSDVYDVATLLVSELDFLHAQRPEAAPPRRVYNPGRKLPSHVYQRIGILCGQMEALRQKVEENPGWLKD